MKLPQSKTRIESEIDKKIVEFYLREDVSRELPGMKDFVSVKAGDKRQKLQKRLLLHTIAEVHELFLENFPNDEVCKTKFASLRPENCVFAGSPGTIQLCTCKICGNLKLKLDAVNIKRYFNLQKFSHCTRLILCENASQDCYNLKCSKCPGMSHFLSSLSSILESESVEDVLYKEWDSTDRTEFVTKLESLESFILKLERDLKCYLPHKFVKDQQSKFYQTKKANLKVGELLIVEDFSQNYSFLVQDAVQSYYWTNNQSTVYPMVGYYIGTDGELRHLCFVVISECLHHDATAVHVYDKLAMKFFKEKLTDINMVYHFSDGAGSQYKNKYNFVNISFHEKDHNVPCEWHFYATSHGKGPSDGLGGTVKRCAKLASIRGHKITTPLELYEYHLQKSDSIDFAYVTTADYDKAKDDLKSRFEFVKTVPGTRAFHSIIPLKPNTVLAKSHSFANNTQEFSLL